MVVGLKDCFVGGGVPPAGDGGVEEVTEVVGFEGVDLDLDELAVLSDEPWRAGVGSLSGLGRQIVFAEWLSVRWCQCPVSVARMTGLVCTSGFRAGLPSSVGSRFRCFGRQRRADQAGNQND